MKLSQRPTNKSGQFVLPQIPPDISADLAALVHQYRASFDAGSVETVDTWNEAAAAVNVYQPRSSADLATKLILSMHFRDPGTDGGELAITAPEGPCDRLALEMELSCIDWLISALPGAHSTMFDVAHAKYRQAKAIENGATRCQTLAEEERQAAAYDAALAVTDAAFDEMIVIPVTDGPRVWAKFAAILDHYAVGGFGLDEGVQAQVFAEAQAALTRECRL
jgi:hypothetical protein